MATEPMENDHERPPVVRRGYNDSGRRLFVLANHFQVTVNPPSDGCCFYAYTVTIKHIGRGVLVCLESLRRQILDKLFENREFAYDGESSLFTVATPLFPENCPLNETVNDLMIPINGGDDGVGEEQFRVFDAILRQSAIKPMNEPRLMLEEKLENANKPASVRVDEMIKDVLDQVGAVVPKFLLCILPENKNCHLYGPLKRKTLIEVGITTQCVATPDASQPPPNYIRNLLLKINAKLIGLNWVLAFELPKVMQPPRICEVNTLIIGLGLCHVLGKPSIAAVVLLARFLGPLALDTQLQRGLSYWHPKQYKLCVKNFHVSRIQAWQLLDRYTRIMPRQLPDRIIIFRDGDGVSESEFDRVLRDELDKIVKACKLKDESWSPKMMVVVARERHNTILFHTSNVLPGTMVDTRVCHPRNNDFYLCAEGGSTERRGRPTIMLCMTTLVAIQVIYMSSCTRYPCRTSQVTQPSPFAPILYARRAAAKMSEVAQSLNPGEDLPRLHKNVSKSMFFC
ncbi:Protein argonaute-4 [Orobanche gracilis]